MHYHYYVCKLCNNKMLQSLQFMSIWRYQDLRCILAFKTETETETEKSWKTETELKLKLKSPGKLKLN